jgi:amino-acid N-acetyltransferase
MPELYIRKARITDVKTIHGLLMDCSRRGELLPRSYQELYSHLRDFFVVASQDGAEPIVGCCALTIAWEDLAEIRSLAVTPALQGLGWGRRLVEACLSEAVTLGLFRVFTLTYQTGFFGRMAFREVDKDVLPQKVWSDCLRCPKFPECDETAMLMEM